ncbi:MAG TPA: FimV/HubP family polar landmark protein, partial [Usitatibacter sp.]|nr:FimV/HubP family polar landmark protein [Usitatibacter sp.]
AAGLVDTGNSSFLTDFDKTGPGTIDTDEVDPVAEAEVYIAYGRDAQAEEILKEAMARDRTRHEIPLKLLEIYHARKSATAFENVARELRSNVGEDSPLWHKAAAMGVQIDPTNPLYSAAAHEGSNAGIAPAVAAAPRPDLDFDVDAARAPEHVAHAQPTFDLDLDAAHKAEEHAPPASLDFDLDHAPHAHAPIDVPLEPAKEEKPAFDFDLSGLDFPGSKSTTVPDLDLGNEPSHDLNLADLNLETESGGAESEGVGTKLELAKAYLEIGDKDGAREILQEVAKEGSNAQRAEAEKLMAAL